MASVFQNPLTITTEDELDAILARPYPALVEFMQSLDGDIAILGIAGKMGMTLGQLAVNAIRAAGVSKKVYGVSRFSDPAAPSQLEAIGIVPLRCDLLDRASVGKLPSVPNVIYMAGRKFGTGGEEDLTWAMNVLAPANVAEAFPASRIVAFSTGCVYPLRSAAQGGCTEDIPPAPVGEYAQSCLGRERVFGYYSRRQGTPVCLLRLNYALDLRYGVLHDIAQTVWQGLPLNLNVPCFNGIWQGDANNQTLLALNHCGTPPAIINLTGPETISVADLAAQFAQLFDKPLMADTSQAGKLAYLNDAGRSHKLFGQPRVALETVVKWTADWIRQGGRSLGKPTHFEVSSGAF